MSGGRTTPRFDVVATTRRRWSREQKRAIVAEIDVGGATLSEVARRHGIHASLLFRWRKDLGSVFWGASDRNRADSRRGGATLPAGDAAGAGGPDTGTGKRAGRRD